MRINGLVLAATHSGAGKTTLSMGIMGALARSMRVQAFKVGPDYIDPSFHTFITGRHCRNLDSWLLEEELLRHLYRKNAAGADICIVEGVMGLYDGAGTLKDRGSTAHIAKLLGAPVVLVIDGRGMAASAAAVVLGYREYDRSVDIKGVIFNNISGEKHYRLLKKAVERDTGVKALGYLPLNERLRLPSRHLGLVPSGEIEGLAEKLEGLAEMVAETVDLPGLLQVAAGHRLPDEGSSPQLPGAVPARLGVAYDSAFNFYYRDSLELLEELGAELIYFSPLKETGLPPGIEGLLMGGGFPEVFAAELEANTMLKKDIREAAAGGMPVYGECGGLMYLSESIASSDGRPYEMVGAFPGKVRMTGRLQRFGYVEVELEAANLLGSRGQRVRAHEFHHSVLEGGEENDFSFRVHKTSDGKRAASWRCGIKRDNLLASYPHLHFYGNVSMAASLLHKCREYRERRND